MKKTLKKTSLTYREGDKEFKKFYEMLFINLYNSIEEKDTKVFAIQGLTDSLDNVIFCQNISLVAKANKKKVLLIDADSENGFLFSKLVTKPSFTMKDYIYNNIEIEKVVFQGEENLDYIVANDTPGMLDIGITNKDITNVIDAVKKDYDIIIVNLPVFNKNFIKQVGSYADLVAILVDKNTTNINNLLMVKDAYKDTNFGIIEMA